MEVVHIATAPNGNYLVTYMLTADEFNALRAQAEAQGELNEDDISGNTIQSQVEMDDEAKDVESNEGSS